MTEPRYDGPTLSPERTVQLRVVVMEATAGRRRHAGWKITVVAVGAAGLLAVAGGAAVAVVTAARADHPNEAYCSSALSLDENIWRINVVAAAQSRDGRPDTISALDACRIAWRVAHGGPANDVEEFDDPQMSACIVDGSLVVYYTADACRALGIPRAESDTLDPRAAG